MLLYYAWVLAKLYHLKGMGHEILVFSYFNTWLSLRRYSSRVQSSNSSTSRWTIR